MSLEFPPTSGQVPGTDHPIFTGGVIIGVLTAIGGVFASIVQNVVFAFKARSEIRRQDKLDKWAREDLNTRVKELESKLKEASSTIEVCEAKCHDSLRKIEELENHLKDAGLREHAASILIETLSKGQVAFEAKIRETGENLQGQIKAITEEKK